MIFGMTTFTFVHVALSLVGIASGFIVLYGLLTSRAYGNWTALFLATTLATTITGFGFPFTQLLPSHITGFIELATLGLAIVGRYVYHLMGAWRPIFVVSAVISLYLNVFVLVVQIFLKIPAVNRLAPTQSEPPFLIAQLAVLIAFIALGYLATVKFRYRARYAG
jgi:hypothetical protein